MPLIDRLALAVAGGAGVVVLAAGAAGEVLPPEQAMLSDAMKDMSTTFRKPAMATSKSCVRNDTDMCC